MAEQKYSEADQRRAAEFAQDQQNGVRPPCVRIGKHITIAPGWTAGNVWLYWDVGEGMEVDEAKLAECLENFYKENF